MKTLKMSLANIQGKLSRAEIRKVMAGSGPCPNGQNAYMCIQIWSASNNPSGLACGTTALDAATKVQNLVYQQTGVTIAVSCS